MHMFACLEIRGQLLEVSSSLLLCGSQGLNSCHQTWLQAPVSAQPYYWPLFVFWDKVYYRHQGLPIWLNWPVSSHGECRHVSTRLAFYMDVGIKLSPSCFQSRHCLPAPQWWALYWAASLPVSPTLPFWVSWGHLPNRLSAFASGELNKEDKLFKKETYRKRKS